MKNKWTKYFHETARMWLDLEVILRDLNSKVVFHAIDTNILLLYANPMEKHEYVRSCKDEDKSRLTDIAITLSELLFSGAFLAKNKYLLYPGPLYEELIDVYYDLLFSAEKEKNKITQDESENIARINRNIDKIKTKIKDDESRKAALSILIQRSQGLVRFLSPIGYKSKTSVICRLSDLGDNARLCSLDKEMRLPSVEETEVKKSSQYQRWNRVLRSALKSNNSSRSESRIRNDVTTLAMIAIINQQLQHEKKSSKLLYITGDATAHAAALKLEPELGSDFIRHPRQYISFIRLNVSYQNLADNIGINSNPFLNEEASRLHNESQNISVYSKETRRQMRFCINGYKKSIQNLFWPILSSQDDLNRIKPRRLIRKIFEGRYDTEITKLSKDFKNTAFSPKNYDQLINTRKEWLSLGALCSKRIVSDKDMVNCVARKLLEDENIYKLISDKEKEVFGEVTENHYAIGALTFILPKYQERIQKYLTDIQQKGRNAARGPVTLRRRDEKGDIEFFEKIHQYVYENNQTELWNAINGSSLYIIELVLALVCADANEWREARKHCERAVTSPYQINEGRYFLAVAIRHSCKSLEDYLKAKEELDLFNKLWNQRYKGKRVDFRYESEQLSLETAYFNYQEFLDKTKWDEEKIPHRPRLADTWRRLWELDERVRSAELEESTPKLMFSRVKRQIYSSLCCLFLFDYYITEDKILSGPEGERAYLALQETVRIRRSYFINFLLACMSWHIDRSQSKWEKALQETDNAYQNSNIPYERPKYSRFMEAIWKHGNRNHREELQLKIASGELVIQQLSTTIKNRATPAFEK